jgi:hypothetical protein
MPEEAWEMIKELDTVVLTHDIPEHGLETGDVGAVVHAYEHADAYEVEFVTAEGRTVAVLSLRGNDIRAMAAREILHARPLPAAAHQ